MIPDHWRNVPRGTKLTYIPKGGSCFLVDIGTTSASVRFPWAKKPTEVKLEVL
jgi:hypothetical protein